MIIAATLVKELRERTGAGMMDCKQALVETSGNFDKAVDWLRTKGLAAASKKAGRETTEGVVALSVEGNVGVIIELNSETDFVARNDKFQHLAQNILAAARGISSGSLDELLSAKYAQGSQTVSEAITEGIAVIGENLSLRKFGRLSVNEGVVASYVHNNTMENGGKIGVLIALESTMDKEKLLNLGRQIAMHIAAARPEALDTTGVDQAKLEHEKSIFAAQAATTGKPENVIEKMLEGRIRKYYQEIVLLEQLFVMDSKTKVLDVVNNFAKENGSSIIIKDFIRFELGESSK